MGTHTQTHTQLDEHKTCPNPTILAHGRGLYSFLETTIIYYHTMNNLKQQKHLTIWGWAQVEEMEQQGGQEEFAK